MRPRLARIHAQDELAHSDGLEPNAALGVGVDGAAERLDGLGMVAEPAQTFAELDRPRRISRLVLFEIGIAPRGLPPISLSGRLESFVLELAQIGHERANDSFASIL